MKAPFEQQRVRSQRDILIDEFRLCMAAAAGCSVVGLMATTYHSWLGQTTPFAALLVVGGFYAVMACGRMVKYFMTPLDSTPPRESGH